MMLEISRVSLSQCVGPNLMVLKLRFCESLRGKKKTCVSTSRFHFLTLFCRDGVLVSYFSP